MKAEGSPHLCSHHGTAWGTAVSRCVHSLCWRDSSASPGLGVWTDRWHGPWCPKATGLAAGLRAAWPGRWLQMARPTHQAQGWGPAQITF